MSTFTLEIQMGNDAMQGPEDVARALTKIGEALFINGLPHDEPRVVRDDNGNRVGSFFMTGEE